MVTVSVPFYDNGRFTWRVDSPREGQTGDKPGGKITAVGGETAPALVCAFYWHPCGGSADPLSKCNIGSSN